MVHLHQQLASEPSSAERKSLRDKSFDELSLLVTEHATKLVSNMRWMGEKVRDAWEMLQLSLHATCLQIKHLEVTLANKQELVEQMQHAHDEQLEKLAGVAEGRSQQWIQQKADMEQHYSQLLSDIHSRHKVFIFLLRLTQTKNCPYLFASRF